MSPASHAMALLRQTYVGILTRMRLLQYYLDHGLGPAGATALEPLEPRLMLSADLALDEPDLEACVTTNSVLNFSGPLAVEAEDDQYVDETVDALLSVSHGQLQAELPDGQPAEAPSIEITGTLSQVNDALATLVYVPDADYAGDDAMTFLLTDDNTGHDEGAVAITVDPAKDPPIVNLPTSAYMVADSQLYFSLLNPPLEITDPEAPGALYEAFLAMNHGGVQASDAGGATITGDPNVELVISGTLGQVNAALDSLVFSPTAGYVGTAGFDLFVSAGYPGDPTPPASAQAAVPVTVLESLTPHTITTPETPTAVKDAPLYFTSAHGTEIRFVDDQSEVGQYNATCVVPVHGAIYIGDGAGTAQVGGTPSEMWIDGTLDEVNTAFDAMYFVPEAGYTGAAGIQIYSMKYLQACYDGWQTVDAAIDITAYDPVLAAPAVVEGTSDGPITVVDDGTSVAIADGLDQAISPTYIVTLDPDRGSLTTDAVADVTVTGPTDDDDALVLSGSRDALNDALASLQFTAPYGTTGTGTIAVTIAWPDAGSTDPIHSRSKLIQVLLDAPDAVPPDFATDHVDLVAHRSGGLDLIYPLPLTDPQGDYTYTVRLDGVEVDPGAGPMTVDPATGVFTWLHTHPDPAALSTVAPGRHVVRIEATDGTAAASIGLSVRVIDASPAPIFEIDPVGDRAIGETYVQPFRVRDPAADAFAGTFYLAVSADEVTLAEAVLVDAEQGDLDVTERFALADADLAAGEIVLFLKRDGDTGLTDDPGDATAFEPELLGRNLAGKTLRITLTAESWTGASSSYACSFRVDVDPAHTQPVILSAATDTLAPISWDGPPTYRPWAYPVETNLSAPIYKYELLPAEGASEVVDGLSISELHGLLAWDPASIAEAAPATGEAGFSFIVRVTDMLGGVAEQTFNVTVRAADGNHTVRGLLYDDRNGNGVRDGISATATRPLLFYVVDVSGSVEPTLVGQEKDYIDAGNAALRDAGVADNVDTAILCFDTNSICLRMGQDGTAEYDAVPISADLDRDGQYDVDEAVDTIQDVGNGGGTYFTEALQTADAAIHALTGGNDQSIERDVILVFLTDGGGNGPNDPEGIAPALQAIDATVEGRDDGIAENGTPSLAVRAFSVQSSFTSAMAPFGSPEWNYDPPAGVDSMALVTPYESQFFDGINDVFADAWTIDVMNPSEPGLADQTVYIDANLNGRLDPGERTTTTGPYGRYAFHGLGEDTYTLRVDDVETVDRGVVTPWVQTSPAQFAPHVIQIDGDGISVDGAPPVAGDTVSDVDFGFRMGTGPDTGAVTGRVFQDFNENGLMDAETLPGEIPHIIFLMDVSDSILARGLRDDEAAAFVALNQYLIDEGFGTSTAVSLVRYSAGPMPSDGTPPMPQVDLAVPNPDGPQGSDNMGWMSVVHNTIPDVPALTPLADYDDDGVLDLEERVLETECFYHTPYIPALDAAAKLLEHYDVAPGDGTVIFLSDGLPTDGIETGPVDVGGITDAVRRLLTLGADIKAFGIGDDALLDYLYILDPEAALVEPFDLPRAIEKEYTRVLDKGLAGWTVYADLNDNGVPDDADADGVPDEPFAITDDRGRYLLADLTPGDYIIRVDLAGHGDWRMTGPASDGLAVSVETSTVLTNADLGVVESTANQPPYFTGLQTDHTLDAGEPWQLEITAADPDLNDQVTLTLLNDDVEGLLLHADLGALTWTPPADLLDQTVTVGLRATDPYGASTTTQLHLTIGANQPPTVLSEPITVFNTRGGGDYQTTITWDDDDTVTAALLDPLDAATMSLADVADQSTTFTWTAAGIAAATADGSDTFAIRVRLTDAYGASTLHAWSLRIVDADPGAPIFDMPHPQTVVVPGMIVLPILAYDPDGGNVTISVDTTDGYALPATAAFDPQAGILCWEPTFADIDTPHTFHFKAVDDDDPAAETTHSFTITPVLYRANVAPEIDPPTPHGAVVGGYYSVELNATDLDDPEWLTWTVEGDDVPDGLRIVRTGSRTATLEWIPTTADLGTHTLTLRVTDVAGATDTLALPVTVHPTPPAPTWPTATLGEAVLDEPYSCAMTATGLTEDVTYELIDGPDWMTMVDNVVQGTPDAVGTVQFTVKAICEGRWAQRTFQVTVLAAPPLRWLANDDFYPISGIPYNHTFNAVVPNDATDEDTFIWAEPAIPGMVFDFNETDKTFTLTWDTPAMAYDGERIAVTLANDVGVDTMEFIIRMVDSPTGPTVISPGALRHPTGVPLCLDMTPYVDLNDDLMSFDLTGLPSGAVLDPSTLTLRWTSPSVDTYACTFSAIDLWDRAGSADFTLEVYADDAAPTFPVLSVSGDGQQATVPGTGIAVPPDTEITVHVEADDDIAVGHVVLSIQDDAMDEARQHSLDINGDYRFRLGREAVTIRIKAFDLAGNGTDWQTFTVTPEVHGAALPDVTLDEALRHCTLVSGLVQFQATFVDPDPDDATDVDYAIDLIPLDADDNTPIYAATGTATESPSLQPVGSPLDVAARPNGRYRLRIVATHGDDVVSDETDLIIDHGTLSPGNLDLTFTDLSVQAKIPITITRRYSLDEAVNGRSGAFGPGWSCNYDQQAVTVTGLAGSDPDAAFTNATGVRVDLPDGRTFRFGFAPPASDDGVTRPAFSQHGGTVAATLEVADAEIIDLGTTWAQSDRSLQDYNPAREKLGGYYKLTVNHVVYRFDATTGKLTSITDSQGNELTSERRTIGSIRQTTLTASGAGSAVAVSIEYDAEGRIVRITDPAGNAIRYAYDWVTGDLVGVTGRGGDTVTFAYDTQADAPPHRLQTVTDPRDVTVLTASYDGDGYLAGVTDADGFATNVTTTDATTTSTTAGDGQTIIVRDVRGNVLRRLQRVDAAADRYILTLYEYDAADRLTAESVPMLVDSADAVLQGDKETQIDDHVTWKTTTAYNSDGSVHSTTDALGNRTVYRYYNGRLVETVDPAGRRTTYRYNDRGLLIETKDGSGTVTRYAYDDAGNLRTTSRVRRRTGADDEEIVTTTYTYDRQDRVLSQTDAAGRTTWYAYDAMGRRTLSYYHVDDAYYFVPAGPDDQPDGDSDPDTSIITLNEYDTEGRQIRSAEYVYHKTAEELFTPDVDLDTSEFATPLWDATTEYDSLGNVIREVDRYGTETTMTYDRMGRPVATRTRSHDTSTGEQECLTITRTAYDDQGRVLAETDPFAVLNSDPSVPVAPADPAQRAVTFYVYDALGNRIATRRLAGLTITLAPNPDGTVTAQVVDSVDPDQPYTADDLAAMTPVSEEITGYDYADGAEYTPAGQVRYTLDAAGARTDYYDDAAGRQIAVLGPVVDAAGYDGPVRLLTEHTYDAAGRNTRTTTNIAVTDTQTPHPNITSPALRDETHRQATWFETIDDDDEDHPGRLTKTVYNDDSATSSRYDSLGHPVQKTDQAGQSTYVRYDDAGRMTAVILPAVRLSWDVEYGQGTRHYDGLYHPRYEYDYDSFGNLTATRTGIFQTSPSIDEPATSDYFVQTPQETTFTYDAWGRQVSRTLPEGQTETSTYDHLGRVTKTVDFESRVTEYIYDDTPGTGGRLIGKTYRLSEADPVALSVAYHYDALGRETKVVETHWDTTPETVLTTTTAYDARGRVVLVTSPEGTVSYDYDDATGRLMCTNTADGTVTTYQYDPLGRLTEVRGTMAAMVGVGPAGITTYTYDLMGNLAETRTGEGTLTTYTYDTLNRLTELTHYRQDATPDDLADNVVLARFTYTLDPTGRRIAATETRLDDDGVTRTTTIQWTYDNLGRLVAEAYDGFDDADTPLVYRDTYAYDIVGNRLEYTHDDGDDGTIEKTVASTYDLNDRLLTEDVTGQTAQQITYDYDSNDDGDNDSTKLLGKTVVQDGVIVFTAVYTYGPRGRMTSAVVDADGDGPGEPVVSEYTYNDDGIRTSETIVGAQTRTFLIDAHNPTGYAQVLQVATDGVVTRTFQLGHDVVAEYAVDPAGLTPIVLLADGHGSTRLLADAAGITQAIYAYTAYGVELDVDAVVLSDPAIWTTDLRFSGEWTDVQSTGLQYLRERYYDSEIGSFMILDPWAGNEQDPPSLHKYLYCHADPVNHVDPSGLLALPGLLGEATWYAGTAIQGAGVALQVLGLAKFVVSAVNYVSASISLALGPTDPYSLKFYRAQQDAALKGMVVGAATVAAGYGLYVVGGAMATAAACWQAAASSGSNSRILQIGTRDLQKVFMKHGSDFGLRGNWNPGRAVDVSRAINSHINSPGIRAIRGTYRGQGVIHYLDLSTGLNVISDPYGRFVGGWKLGPAQLQSVLTSGRLF
ncbi:MAG: putative Ig domain-containing protein [Planctomycetota bacterium]